MKTKLVALMLCVLLVISMGLVGCSGSGEDANTGEESGKTEATEAADKGEKEEESMLTAPGEFPIVKDGYDVTITGLASTRPKTDNYEDNQFTKWFEEKTNVNLDIAAVNEKEWKDKLNLLMASGDYPDMLLGVNGVFSLAEQQLYAEQGILLPLDEMIDEMGVESKPMLEEFPVAREMFTLLDGNIYTIPTVDECYHCMNTSKLWIYTPWLEAVGMDMPTTTDEFYAVLKAFKEQDPNGNGVADEIPMMGSFKGWDTQVENFLMGAFAHTDGGQGDGHRLYVIDGKVTAPFVTEEWREGLRFFNKLVNEGLLATESFTQDNNQLKTVAENPDAPLVGCAPGGSVGPFVKINGESGRWLEYKTIPALKGPNGAQFTNYKPYNSYKANFHITDACEYPEVAFRLGDAMINMEVMMHSIYGDEGEEWAWAEEGDKGIVDEFPGVWKELIPMQDKPQNSCWEQQGPRFRPVEFRLGRVTDSPVEKILYDETKKNYAPYWPDESQIIPPLIFEKEAAAELVDIHTNIKNYVDEMFARFATGDADLDKDWDAYVKEIEGMDLARYIELYQAALDER